MSMASPVRDAKADAPTAGAPAQPLVEVVVPVHNEQRTLEASIWRLHGYLTAHFPFAFRITVADNASTDATWPLARKLAEQLPRVRAVHLDQKGRGRALRHVWSGSDADVVAYMDVDLSTGLEALLPLVAPLLSGHSDLAIGSRLARGAAVVRGPRRELVSRCYNLLLRATLRAWFFDTELLLLAERSGLRIHEVPVDWVEDPDSRVDVLRTALDDLRGMARVGPRLLTGTTPSPAVPAPAGMARQLPSFAAIGVVSTLAYPGAVLAAAHPGERHGGQRRRAAGERGGQHRRQPPLDVRRPRRPGAAAPPPRRAGRVRPRPRADQRRAVAARPGRRRRRPGGRDGRAAGRQRRRDPAPLHPAALLGLPPATHPTLTEGNRP